MNIKQLEYFLELSATLNFTKAAKNLFVSQTAITKQIQNLEQELGMKLFERNRKQVLLTEAGEMYVGEAECILKAVDQSFQHMKAYKRGESGCLKIGFLKDFAPDILIGMIQNFKQQYPQIELELGGYSNHLLYEKLWRGELDIIICMDSHEAGRFVKWKLADYPLVGIISRKDALAHKPTIHPEEMHHLVFDLRDGIKERENMELEGALIKVACHMGEAIALEFVVNQSMRQYVETMPLEPYEIKSIYLMHTKQEYNRLIPHFVRSCTEEL